jgi:Tfp pilus assembly protein PilF
MEYVERMSLVARVKHLLLRPAALLLVAVGVLIVVFRQPAGASASLRTPELNETIGAVALATAAPKSNGMQADGQRGDLAALLELQAGIVRSPDDASIRLRFARLAIVAARAESDPHYLGQAEAALTPLTTNSVGSAGERVEAKVLHATVLQGLHRFGECLKELDEALQLEPNHDQAWLTRAAVLTVLGRYDEAHASCKNLSTNVARVQRAACHEPIFSITGQAREAYQRLSIEVSRVRAPSTEEVAYFYGLLGELAASAGLLKEANQHLERSLAAAPKDPYILGAWADLRLDQGDAASVYTRLKPLESNDNLLLRLAIAAKNTKKPEASRYAEMLNARFNAARERQDSLHLREEARYELQVAGASDRALAAAEANWAVQKELADARILLESAIAAKAPERARGAADWMQSTHCQEPNLTRLMTERQP